MTINGQLTYQEITSQAEAASVTVQEIKKKNDWINKFIANTEFDEVVFIGSGSSYYQAQVMASTFRKWLGRSANAYPSSEIFLFREQASLASRNYLLVGVSRSGESTEVILAIESVKNLPNWNVCGITCYENSKMAQICECIVSPHGKEKSVVMTKSFSSMVFMMQYAIAIVAKDSNRIAELEQAIKLYENVVDFSNQAIQQFVNTSHYKKAIYLGMGTYFGLSQEASLKIKEMCCFWSESYGTLEFRHGPKSIVDSETVIILLVSEQARQYELKVAEEMQEFGAKVILITAKHGPDTKFADLVIEIGGHNIEDESRTVLYLPALQYLGFYTALKNNSNPDQPRHLTQVVKI